MSLETRGACGACGTGLPPDEPAFICSQACTYCESCADGMGRVCPNCGGELVRRPRGDGR